ncbi:unnamed protein product [Staurois parvus]|uniref:Uncharacterized protein n=1 Tax=Staurois parvus TaxID=386267 RepID=A0ABN9CY36_9NEOB|nr:unnamed protein product [Staurois parvus]
MSTLIRQTETIALLDMLSLVCIARLFVFFLVRVHVISTGSISTVQTEVRGSASSEHKENSFYKL